MALVALGASSGLSCNDKTLDLFGASSLTGGTSAATAWDGGTSSTGGSTDDSAGGSTGDGRGGLAGGTTGGYPTDTTGGATTDTTGGYSTDATGGFSGGGHDASRGGEGGRGGPSGGGHVGGGGLPAGAAGTAGGPPIDLRRCSLDVEGDCGADRVCVYPGVCVLRCTTDTQCETGRCDTTLGICVECLDENDCWAQLPVCGAEGRCVECLQDDQCASQERPKCGGGNRCVCTETSCPQDRPICDYSHAECVECNDAEPCSDPERPNCDAFSGSCVECSTRIQCASGAQCDLETNLCIR